MVSVPVRGRFCVPQSAALHSSFLLQAFHGQDMQCVMCLVINHCPSRQSVQQRRSCYQAQVVDLHTQALCSRLSMPILPVREISQRSQQERQSAVPKRLGVWLMVVGPVVCADR